ncbi:MAG: TIGR04283 family arsenosugar biosynthesis glycosyltransferase [Proteobacteria bacterium]|nr:TIGR04283 family arsenosugar biosynthesis glycosyltransferase [Pseudomonadota bacterium]
MDLSTPSFALSVIVPVYREQARIAALLSHLADIPAPGGPAFGAPVFGVEILVVDGDPERRTLAALPEGAATAGIRGLASDQGRARQMNAGAAAARGDALLFLHADTRLPLDAFARIEHALADEDISGGAFALRITPEDGGQPGPGLRFIAWAANLRSRFTRAPYGDQGIFLRRECFEVLGGFADIPLMEDLEFMTRLRRSGRRIRLLSACAATSARRWEREGLLRCTLRNLLLRAFYHLGVRPQQLARFYP